jgi:HPt (histidine-containing phosphotransfer) domain-containing protein
LHVPVPPSDPPARSKPVPAIDRDHLTRQTGGDQALAREALRLFRHQARGLMFRLEATTDPAGRADIAHLLLGSARAIGAGRLAAAAADLETAARDDRNVCAALRTVAEATAEAIGAADNLLADS